MNSNSADPNSNLTFRKPSNDVGKRKYRRHSPASGSPSPHGSPKGGRDSGSVPTIDSSHGKVSKHKKRKSNEEEWDRNSGRSRYGKGEDSYRNYDRHSSRNSHGYLRHGDYRGHPKSLDEGRYSRSSPDYHGLKGATHSDHRREESDSRSRDSSRNDKYESLGYRVKTEEKEQLSSERQKLKDQYLSADQLDVGRKHSDLTYEEKDRDRRRSVRNSRDQRSFVDHRSDRTLYSEEARGHRNNSSRRHGEGYPRESYKEDMKESNDLKERKKHDSRETFRDKDHQSVEPAEQNEHKSSFWSGNQEVPTKKLKSFSSAEDVHDSRDVNDKQSSSSKLSQEIGSKSNVEHANASSSEAVSDLNAAKVAAMKAAELVNKNLVGVGFMSTDQKKKLLWGNKKSSTSEESGHQWDAALFGDRERQEKFNKLMSLRLAWYISPIVGCERRGEDRAETRGPRWEWSRPSCEAAGTSDGFGEAVYSWTSSKGWPHCGIGTLNVYMLHLRCVSKLMSGYVTCILCEDHAPCETMVVSMFRACVVYRYLITWLRDGSRHVEYLLNDYLLLLDGVLKKICQSLFCFFFS